MKLTNKTLIAALLLAVTLTGCDSLKNKLKNTEDKKVEEQTDETGKKEGEEDAENTGSTEEAEEGKDSEEGEESKEGKDAEEGEESKEDKKEKSGEAETDPGKTVKEKLEDAIFKNRVQSRAAEILLQEAPESLSAEQKAKLEKLIEESNKLIEKAEEMVDSL